MLGIRDLHLSMEPFLRTSPEVCSDVDLPVPEGPRSRQPLPGQADRPSPQNGLRAAGKPSRSVLDSRRCPPHSGWTMPCGAIATASRSCRHPGWPSPLGFLRPRRPFHREPLWIYLPLASGLPLTFPGGPLRCLPCRSVAPSASPIHAETCQCACLGRHRSHPCRGTAAAAAPAPIRGCAFPHHSPGDFAPPFIASPSSTHSSPPSADPLAP
jgi:hypothetical protein